MATAKVKVYPYVTLDLKGNLQGIYAAGWKVEDSVSEYSLQIGLPMIEVEVFVPDEGQLRLGAAQMIDEKMTDARAKFHAQQTLMQSVKNDLLRLEHVDVLDRADKPTRNVEDDVALEESRDDIDDIPF